LTTGGTTSLEGKTVIFTPATGSALTLTITSTAGAGNVNSLDALNAALSTAGIGVTASVSSTGFLTFTSSNDNASQSITVAGSASANTVDITGTTVAAIVAASGTPVADAASQTIRANLVSQYNNVIQQITTTAQDSSFNGINLLNGDNLKLTFNETGKSTLNIQGVTFDAAGLGLASLTSGTDFLDNASANSALTLLGAASTTLRTEASALGSNLSIVQIRQDFSKNLINVLQTGSSNLTLADTNEEAANSQALSTRQSIAVSALALANQSQQSVLQLLR
jgi:flagellin-like hook-associated protein FlgL